MLFVDGENITIEGEKVARRHNVTLRPDPLPASRSDQARYYVPSVYLWFPSLGSLKASSGTHLQFPSPFDDQCDEAERAYYYTSVQGDDHAKEDITDGLWSLGFEPVVFKKPKGRIAKGVDIAITRDMLVHAFDDHYDIAVLMSSDRDFVPTIEEVKRRGKRVLLATFSHNLDANLRRASDGFRDLTHGFLATWQKLNRTLDEAAKTAQSIR